jgi:hypothetical protein
MKKYIVILLAAMTSMSVFAHTGLTSSTPKDNAMLMENPEKIEVTFGDAVRLVSLTLVNSKDEPVEIDFAPSMEASETFTYALPMLMPSNYKASWTIMGEDGHKMKGDFTFMVHAMDKMKGMKKMDGMKDMKDMKDKKMDHAQHNGH